MAKETLIDDHVSVAQCKKAVTALHVHGTKHAKEKEEKELLPGKEEFVWLVLTTKKTFPEKKLKPIKVPVVHPLVDPRTTSICLITKDPQREYKDLVAEHNIKFISRVVGITKLKGKFKPFEARRMLLQENGMFLADERVVPLLPGLLGKKFFEAKKQPIPVCLTRKDLKGELERAINSTYMHQNQGTCTSIKIGTLSHTPAQILDNLTRALPDIIKHTRDKWDNVQSLNIKTNSSVSLPIWSCALGEGEDSRWGETYEDEWTGIGDVDADAEDAGSSKAKSGKTDGKAKSGKKRGAEDDDGGDGKQKQKKAKQKAKTVIEDDEAKDSDDDNTPSPQAPPKNSTPLSEPKSKSADKKQKKAKKAPAPAEEPSSDDSDEEPEPPKPTSKPKAKAKSGSESISRSKSKTSASPPKTSGISSSLSKEELKQKKASMGLEKKKDKVAKGRLAGGAKEKILGKTAKARL